jgi:16S rRNA (uracil1498-N3)-methyltransferase
MRLHRFYVNPDSQELDHEFWLKDMSLRRQWQKVFRYLAGDKVILFDGKGIERLYELVEIAQDAIRLRLSTEMVARSAKDIAHIYLFFSLLKKSNNEFIIQKCTELGVTHFIPITCERTIVTGFDNERAVKIAIEAAEQCGRNDIPSIREPISIHEVAKEYPEVSLYYAEQDEKYEKQPIAACARGILIGPEGGWTDTEKELLQSVAKKITLGTFTLRAETAAIAACAYLHRL